MAHDNVKSSCWSKQSMYIFVTFVLFIVLFLWICNCYSCLYGFFINFQWSFFGRNLEDPTLPSLQGREGCRGCRAASHQQPLLRSHGWSGCLSSQMIWRTIQGLFHNVWSEHIQELKCCWIRSGGGAIAWSMRWIKGACLPGLIYLGCWSRRTI